MELEICLSKPGLGLQPLQEALGKGSLIARCTTTTRSAGNAHGGCLAAVLLRGRCGRGGLAPSSPRFPAIFASQFVNVVVHLFGRKFGICLVAVGAAHSRGLEEVPDEDLGAEAEMLAEKVLHAILFQVLQVKETLVSAADNIPKAYPHDVWILLELFPARSVIDDVATKA